MICKYSCIFLRIIDPHTDAFAGLLEPLRISFKRHIQWFYVISRPKVGFQRYTIEDCSFDLICLDDPLHLHSRAQWFWYLRFQIVRLLSVMASCAVLRLLELFAVSGSITFVVNRYSALHYFHLQQDNKRWLSGEALTYQICLRNSTQNRQ